MSKPLILCRCCDWLADFSVKELLLKNLLTVYWYRDLGKTFVEQLLMAIFTKWRER